MISFIYLEPADIDEALAALARYGDEAKVIAGGTGLVNLMKQRLVQPTYLIGLRRLAGLSGLHYDGDLRIGALCSHRKVETASLVQTHASLLAETFQYVASVRIRTMATIGGALAHADPNQDPPPALMVLDARVRLRSQQRAREVSIGEFFTGYYETLMAPDELITEVIIPPPPVGSGTAFVKFLPQTHDDYATVAVAARLTLDGDRIVDARVALGAAAATPLRATVVEDALRGQAPTPTVLREAAALVAEAVDPTSDFRGSAAYKREMAVVFVRRALAQAAARARAGGGAA
ncbi:MAG TPA: xanthine dehydrogenase family protein subunit M [Candidatus Binatia bacterium]|jgi:carbon-monoxide dehydrogenase medium subunit|nr:xanthine dehydrogenase family protein subunit M [Candidatus Binatia bacterium]